MKSHDCEFLSACVSFTNAIAQYYPEIGDNRQPCLKVTINNGILPEHYINHYPHLSQHYIKKSKREVM